MLNGLGVKEVWGQMLLRGTRDSGKPAGMGRCAEESSLSEARGGELPAGAASGAAHSNAQIWMPAFRYVPSSARLCLGWAEKPALCLLLEWSSVGFCYLLPSELCSEQVKNSQKSWRCQSAWSRESGLYKNSGCGLMRGVWPSESHTAWGSSSGSSIASLWPWKSYLSVNFRWYYLLCRRVESIKISIYMDHEHSAWHERGQKRTGAIIIPDVFGREKGSHINPVPSNIKWFWLRHFVFLNI